VRATSIASGFIVAALGVARSVAPEPSTDAPKPVVERAADVPDAGPPPSPATRYVALTSDACLAELGARGIAYVRVDEDVGVETPVRIVGPLSGVGFRTLRPNAERQRSPYEICDCRLVLALDDFAKILARHSIVDVMFYSAFRPLVPGVVKRGHESGLAIDIAFFGKRDGFAYNILRDFTPIAREHPCAPVIRAEGPRELRAMVCEAVEQRIVHVALTPDYDKSHRDHFHLELVPGEQRSFAR
jgi:hypothetical protein